MAIEIVLKYILCYAVLLLVSPSTFADEAFPPTMVQLIDEYPEYKSTYTLPKPCNFSSPYRTIDGSCNNQEEPLMGKSFTPFKRILSADYDYILFPDNSRPDSRDLSRTLFQENTNQTLEETVNVFFVTFGQAILHDMALAQTNHDSVKCCPNPTNATECMPDLYKDEQECNTHNPTCHNFVRNLGVGQLSGDFGNREQLNRITHYLDGSVIYGSTQEELDSLRDINTGKMKVTNVGNNHLLPVTESETSNNCPFFRGGDSRVSAVITITTHHIFWVREHNAIVDGLFSLHNNWSKEKLFQEARKIIVAEFQHIAYQEFLPLLIGQKNIEDYNLNFTSWGVYQPEIDASTSNAFTTSAFRHAHLMLEDVIFFDQKDRDPSRRNTTGICKPGIKSLSCDSAPNITLREALNSADRLFSCENSVDALISGTIKRSAQISNDMRVSETIKKLGPGLDLISIDIERGRDHGIPSYTAWRNWCSLEPFTFDTDSNTHKSCILRKLQRIYGTEDAIDLYVGASLENKIDDAVLGQTYACIIASQMSDTKYGDRFWYQNNQFTPDQLNEISRQRMSMILKRNTNISSVPVNPFVTPTNITIFQNNDTAFNLTAWA